MPPGAAETTEESPAKEAVMESCPGPPQPGIASMLKSLDFPAHTLYKMYLYVNLAVK